MGIGSLCLSAFAALPYVLAQDSVSYDLEKYGEGDAGSSPFQTFMSNGDVKPPVLQINRNGTGLAEGFVFIGVNGNPSSEQNWPTIWGSFSSSHA